MLLLLLVDDSADGLTGLTPANNEGLTDQEEHDADLGNGEEAPDGGLLEEVGGDEAGHEGAGAVEEGSLDDHTLLLVQGEERSEHEEAVEADALDVVGGISHGDGPAQVDHRLGLEGADILATDPLPAGLGGDVLGVPAGDVGEGIAGKDEETADEAEALDDGVLVAVLGELSIVLSGVLLGGELGQRLVDHMAEVGLEANVDETANGEELVDEGLALGGVEASSDENVLDGLKHLHGEEEEDTSSELTVAGRVVDPPRDEEAKQGKASGHVTVKAHS